MPWRVAFSITTKKPTAEWEGDITAEAGNFGRLSVEGGVGGPISDTWGIRVAGQFDRTKGHLIDVFNGEAFPYKREMIGRVITQWAPTENFQALFKVDYMVRRSEGDPNAACISTGIDDLKYDETAILFRGEVPEWDATHARQRQFPNCADGFNRIGFKEGQEFCERPVQGINGAGFYTSMFDNRYVPDAWDTRRPVDVVLLRGFSSRPGPFLDTYSEDSFDPQVTLRYRPLPGNGRPTRYYQLVLPGPVGH
jgi:hypothetical protein